MQIVQKPELSNLLVSLHVGSFKGSDLNWSITYKPKLVNQSAQMQDDLIWRLVDVKANLLSKRHMFIKYFSLLIYFSTYLRNLNIMNI